MQKQPDSQLEMKTFPEPIATPIEVAPAVPVEPELTLEQKRENINRYLDFNMNEFKRLLPTLSKKQMMRVTTAIIKYPLDVVKHKQMDDVEIRSLKHAFLAQDMKTLLANFALQEAMEEQRNKQQLDTAQAESLNGETVVTEQQPENNNNGKTTNGSSVSLQQ